MTPGRALIDWCPGRARPGPTSQGTSLQGGKNVAQNDEDDVAVDRNGRPLPLVRMLSKDGVEVDVRDAAGLSLMHYGYGMEFAEENMTYAKALAVLLGEDVGVLVEVPPEGGEIDWHPAEPVAEPVVEPVADDKPKKVKLPVGGGEAD